MTDHDRPGLTLWTNHAREGRGALPLRALPTCQYRHKEGDRQKSVTFLYISNVSSAQDSLQAGDCSAPALDQLQAKVSSCSRSIAGKSQLCSGFIAGKSQLPLRIDCKQTSVLLRLLVVVQRASCGEVVDLALDVLKNCLVLFGTFLGDTVDNIGVLCDG